MKHVFIGHGDSDKVRQLNPFTKVYDEVWVAGPAGRRPLHPRPRSACATRTIVEVGRPQLAASRTGRPGPAR